ncbi:MAG: UvrD-helicase domain-containing protein [Gammaproteobacteria bacterium]|nr:UvrD-helicase domain-containing protein [Gammaproteobacteria bacterium]
MTVIVDAAERARAIDPLQSFCVSAPAGSGKTELLIQRYLGLLARVARPEQVLAITFTRKAAAEMRERVIQALAAADDNLPVTSPHEQVTRDLALAALAAERAGDWQLRTNFSRLNIKTIDGFCRGLVNQMPVMSTFGGQASPTDDATELYEEAVQSLFALLEQQSAIADDLRPLLLHFDNNWGKLQTLLMTMLARRDQWRDYIGVHHSPHESEAYLVQAVEGVVAEQLQDITALLTAHTRALAPLLQYAASNLQLETPAGFPPAEASALPHWRLLRRMLLTQDGQWLKAINKNNGFPAGKGEASARKAELKELIDSLRTDSELANQLQRIDTLPDIAPGQESWQLVLHLSRLLPILGAQLLLVFERRGSVDHSQVAESALLALGEDDQPTELALRMDYSIDHLLVDEFQDTAINQYILLQRLTRGWGEHNQSNPQAPRTLLIVGDAMQSIYGFRDANVGLFIKAGLEGFNGVTLNNLQLRSNFRSDPQLVDWVNATFVDAFPAQDDMYKGLIQYRAAQPVNGAMAQAGTTLRAFYGDCATAAELAFVCSQIQAHLTAGFDDIAVLGRGRAQLRPIAKRLRELQIDYYAPDLDTLADSPVVADLLTLCAALANVADRLAWMALLRAPWTGLTLADLLVIAGDEQEPDHRSVLARLGLPEVRQQLSDDGQVRVGHLLSVMHWAQAKRDRLGLRVWIEQVWTMLGGPACARTAADLEDAESFLRLLEPAVATGNALDIGWLTRQTQERFMSGGDPDSRLQLMTLHKAKGLEFDSVIIPSTASRTRGDTRDILLWDEFTTGNGERVFLLAADDKSDKAPSLYNFLRQQRQQKSLQEATRLLYVGATRARRHLTLTATLHWNEKQAAFDAPAQATLLKPIWPVFEAQATITQAQSQQDTAMQDPPQLQRLASLPKAAASPVTTTPAENRPERPDNFIERCTGTAVHLALELLTQLPELPHSAPPAHRARWRLALQEAGLHGQYLEAALQRVQDAVATTLQPGGKGRWILSNEHEQAHSEWSLSYVDQGMPRNIVIDRSFVDRDAGIRWVVDYKNSQPEAGETIASFTHREQASYADQLAHYCHAVRQLDQRPVHAALYFTALGLWHPVEMQPDIRRSS